MQPGYGIPEIQQFMVDSAFFTLSNDLNPSGQQKHHHHHQHHLQLQQQQQQQNRSYNYQNFQSFLEFENLQQPRRLHHQQQQPPPPPQPPHLLFEPGPENASSRLFPFISNFRHVMDANEPGCIREMRHYDHLADEDLSLGDDGSDRRWPREDVGVRSPNGSNREPVRRLSDFSYNADNRPTPNAKRCRKGGDGNEPPESKSSSSTGYRFFNELELILSGELQAGSGSALTGDNNPPRAAGNPSSAAETAGAHVDLASEASAEEDGSLKKMQQLEKKQQQDQHEQLQRKTKKNKSKQQHQQQQLASIATFFQKLVNQLMEHQEALHRKFMEVMEKKDQERQRWEEEWRRQEATRLNRERALRAQAEAEASSREAAIVSFLEKITGETASLPLKRDVPISQENSTPLEMTSETNRGSGENRRWPKSEVNALIKVRSGLEARFQEPGLKGPLWEGVSMAMARMGYARSAKGCKEKWENINKYFRRTKDSAKRRSQQSKKCPYFDQLDLLYTSKASTSSGNHDLTTAAPANSELLYAILPAGGSQKEEKDASAGGSQMGNSENENEEDRNEEEDLEKEENEDGDNEEEQQH